MGLRVFKGAFTGHNKFKGSAVIVARTSIQAKVVLEEQLKKTGLEQTVPRELIEEIDLDEVGAHILFTGDY